MQVGSSKTAEGLDIQGTDGLPNWMQSRLTDLVMKTHEELDGYTSSAWGAYWSPVAMTADSLVLEPQASPETPSAFWTPYKVTVLY